MARTANPNKEKILAVKAELKEHARTVRLGETAAKKHEKLTERLAKLTGVEAPAAKATKPAKADKAVKGKKAKVDVASEKKKTTKVVTKKKAGRPRKEEDEE
jgi:hypothetical protein